MNERVELFQGDKVTNACESREVLLERLKDAANIRFDTCRAQQVASLHPGRGEGCCGMFAVFNLGNRAGDLVAIGDAIGNCVVVAVRSEPPASW